MHLQCTPHARLHGRYLFTVRVHAEYNYHLCNLDIGIDVFYSSYVCENGILPGSTTKILPDSVGSWHHWYPWSLTPEVLTGMVLRTLML